jgi:hypothetical protein
MEASQFFMFYARIKIIKSKRGLCIRFDLMLIRIRIQFQIQGFDDQENFFLYFWIENCNLLILRPP